MSRALLVGLVLFTGCAATSAELDEPQDADELDELKGDAPTQSCTQVHCGNPAALAILFPGNPACADGGCERNLAGEDLFIPPRNGRPWGDTYGLGTRPAEVLSGYSSGRIALLRRLSLADDGQHAVMLDPSWEDGARDFLGTGPVRGDVIVHDWLARDPSRMFTLIYSSRSVGWASYAALQKSDVGARVRVCVVSQPHLLVPTVPGIHTALVEPLSWNNGTCMLGTGG